MICANKLVLKLKIIMNKILSGLVFDLSKQNGINRADS